MKFILLAIIGIVLVGCGDLARSGVLSGNAQLDGPAAERCKQELPNVVGYGRVDGLSGAFDVTAGQLAMWIETRHGPNGPRLTATRWHTLPALQPLVVCYFDGSFGYFPRPQSNVEPAPYERIRIIIQPGSTGHTLDSAGYRTNLPVVRPVP
jgi:hypothetical protein